MGTFGTGPFDDDASAEFVTCHVGQMLNDTIVRTLRLSQQPRGSARGYQPGRAAIRCALMLCADDIRRLDLQLFEDAQELLERAMADEEFLSSWGRRMAIEASCAPSSWR